ncbi:hypothetical protein NL676_006211 [Syzygium grande]|nr:hypothetical protein NL676_006211 [Syzygium grande]
MFTRHATRSPKNSCGPGVGYNGVGGGGPRSSVPSGQAQQKLVLVLSISRRRRRSFDFHFRTKFESRDGGTGGRRYVRPRSSSAFTATMLRNPFAGLP